MFKTIAKSPIRPPTQPKTILQQKMVAVTLGRPSAYCRHYGICHIEVLGAENSETTACQAFKNKGLGSPLKALLSWQPNQLLELAIWRSTVSAALFKQHFEPPFFLLEEDYLLSAHFFGEQLCFRKGQYNIGITGTLITVAFPYNF